jgi:UTP--glucose-1-phosphate uridylyltransferase
VTDRTAMDRKGGHLARLKRDDHFILRESAQCDERDKPFFSDITRHPFFNTNNIWLNLESVDRALKEKKYLSLPLVINRKPLNPVDPASAEIVQLESAIGSAISIFEKSGAVRVPRTRFAPVKNCEELLLVWSDYFQLTDDGGIRVNPARKTGKVALSLDPRFYSRVDFLQERFPSGAPSLVECDSLTIHGDVKFGRDVRIAGTVTISNGSSEQVTINHHTVIDRDLTV